MSTDFSIVLFGLSIATGLVWLADFAVLRRARLATAEAGLRQYDRQRGLASPAVPSPDRDRLRERLTRRPGWIDLPAGLFPVILAVFLLRSFLFEPFEIPSGSMMPTLLVGDRILVNKFAYGVRLPIIGKEVLALGSPRRGDVVVFRYPLDPSENYVKRLIGLPGDTIVYRDKRLTINGRPVREDAAPDFVDDRTEAATRRFTETLPRAGAASDPVVHGILVDDRRITSFGPIAPFAHMDQCVYTEGRTAVTCKVPQGQYFMMGDNRDNSADSRFWGFVPDANLVGKAVVVWWNFHHLDRIGTFH